MSPGTSDYIINVAIYFNNVEDENELDERLSSLDWDGFVVQHTTKLEMPTN